MKAKSCRSHAMQQQRRRYLKFAAGGIGVILVLAIFCIIIVTTMQPLNISRTEGEYADCAEIKEAFPDSQSGTYKISIYNGSSCTVYNVYCDMETYGGGWTVFQRRFNGSVDFYRNWTEYAVGFGSPNGEHWLGNDAIYLLTQRNKTYKLLVDMRDHYRDCRLNAEYSSFKFTSREKYTLQLGRFERGIAGDSLTEHNGMNFSTFDQDNDKDIASCAEEYSGAWWYSDCYLSNLNGVYRNTPGCATHFSENLIWYSLLDTHYYSLRESMMMLRPLDFKCTARPQFAFRLHRGDASNWCTTKPAVECTNRQPDG